jgi:hypothetical protein
VNGNNSDNRPKNLRLLCPNSNSQLETHGGANKGRVEKAEGGVAIKSKDGKRDHTLPAEPGSYGASESPSGTVVTQSLQADSGNSHLISGSDESEQPGKK